MLDEGNVRGRGALPSREFLRKNAFAWNVHRDVILDITKKKSRTEIIVLNLPDKSLRFSCHVVTSIAATSPPTIRGTEIM